ncbi:amino acid adenylation domain-containing protein [Lysinibacillus sp. NPDC058147]|uniref:non-ribosomal peptide synthetase n=1 Tax=unclassified Lysinibacillus TaxID=2636778 RepID=UPI0036D91809
MDNIETLYELSPCQQGILFHSEFEPEQGLYIVQYSCELNGNLKVSLLLESIQQVVKRHQALRTDFFWKGLEKPVQVVYSDIKIPYEFHDWSNLSNENYENKLQKYLEIDRGKGFTEVPLFRFTLIKKGEQIHQLIITRHHLLLDGWSLSLLLEEIGQGYKNLINDTPIRYRINSQYKDFIQWLQLRDSSYDSNFWENELKDFKAATNIKFAKKTNYGKYTYEYNETELKLSLDLSEKIRQVGRLNHYTINCLLQSIWALLLHRYSLEEEVVFGTTFSGRPAELEGAESILGMFINTLPFKVKIKHTETFSNWVREVQKQFLKIREFEHTPLIKLREWADIPNDQALFNSIFVFESYPETTNKNEWGNVKIQNPFIIERTNYPVSFIVKPGKDITLQIKYKTDEISDETANLILSHFEKALKCIVENPDQQVQDISILSEMEKERILKYSRGKKVSIKKNLLVHNLFEEQVQKTPDVIAVVDDQDKITYRELNEKANLLAYYLRDKGIGPNCLVGVCFNHSIDLVVGILAILKVRGAYVPLDPSYPLERLKFIVKDAKLEIILSHSDLSVLIKENQAEIIYLDSHEWKQDLRNLGNLPCKAGTEDNAYVIYTSGSTGTPKGVVISNKGLVNYLTWALEAYKTSEGNGAPVHSPIGFDLTITSLFLPLLAGKTVSLVSNDLGFDSLSEALKKTKNFSLIKITPAHLQMLSQQLPKNELKEVAKRIVIGGEALYQEHIKVWQEHAPETILINEYGPTETVVGCCIYEVPNDYKESSSFPIGRPINNTNIYVLDKLLRLVPSGITGEIYIGGDGVAKGYLNRPELTQEKFIDNPFLPGERLFKTGDLGRFLLDGNLEYLGRMDTQVKVRGYRIELGEIEAVLNQHPRINKSVVILDDDNSKNKKIVSYIVLEQGLKVETKAIYDWLSSILPSYMIPAHMIQMKELPITTNGKVDKKSLPKPQAVASKQIEETPKTEVEILVADVWSNVLEFDQFSKKDNFFSLGGHSLLAMRIVSEINELLNINLPIRSIFETPTIESFSKVVEKILLEDEEKQVDNLGIY